MKFVATEDIRAPQAHVWDEVTDFDRFEGLIGRKAQNLDRHPTGPAGEGTTWTGRAVVSGKKRNVTVTVVAMEPKARLVVQGGTDGMQITIEALLETQSPEVTRLTVVTEAKARTLAARLLLQSAKLARTTLAKRYKTRVGQFAERVESALVG